jgi:uncharacterized protein YceK
MRANAGAALAALLLLGGCGAVVRHIAGEPACRCPLPIHYSAAQLKAIEKAREALPRDSILQQVLVDYENERDDLRACRGAQP